MRVVALVNGLDGEEAARASYVLRTLLETLGLRHEATEHGFQIPDSTFQIRSPHSATSPEAVVEVACGPAMTADEAIHLHRRVASSDPSLLHAEGAHVRVEANILAAAGLWLTGRDEDAVERDPFGRIPGAATPRAKAGLLATPVVHDLMGLLWAALDRAAGAAGLALDRVPAWPEGRKFAVLLSHDVDLWRKRTARQLAKEVLRGLPRPWRLPAVVRAFCCGPDPWSHLDGIADIEERYGMRSTFFVLAGRPNQVANGVGVVNSYDARREAISDTLRHLVARGWEVGLHGSFDSYRSAEALAGERRDVAALAGAEVIGCRQHFLRFERPVTWRAQAEAGLSYDATLGYYDTDGYRAGFSFPFRPWVGEELPLLELPLVVMDGALLEQQGMDAQAAWERVRRYLERTEADGSMLSLLWHNTHFCELDAPGYRGVYERALGWTREHGGWGAPARDIADWWSRRTAQLTTRR